MLATILWIVAVVAFFAWAGIVLHKRTSGGGSSSGPEVRADRERRAGFFGSGGS